jgi:arginine-tRNA-protein transferase
MKHKPILGTRFLFATAPMPCPYLPDRVERRVVVELTGRDAPALHDALSSAGYRRSHGIAYAPACPDCTACVAVRINAADLVPSRSQRRVWRLNAGVEVTEASPMATREQFDLFSTYQRSRHAEGDMMKMDFVDYQALVADTPVDTMLAEFRDPDGRLIGACLTDHLNNGLSAVYSYFDSNLRRRSIGTYMILWLVERAKALGLPYVYLGFWIDDCAKMSYKTSFQPIEGYTPEGWKPITLDGIE